MHGPAKGAGMTEAHIIQDDDQDVGGAGRGLDLLGKISLGILDGHADFALERLGRNRQHRPVELLRCLGPNRQGSHDPEHYENLRIRFYVASCHLQWV